MFNGNTPIPLILPGESYRPQDLPLNTPYHTPPKKCEFPTQWFLAVCLILGKGITHYDDDDDDYYYYVLMKMTWVLISL